MSDRRIRESERRWREGGDPVREASWLRERLRAGELDPARLEAASLVGHGPAAAVVGPPPGLDEARLAGLAAPGIQVRALEEPSRAALVRLAGWMGDPRRLETVLQGALAAGARWVLLEIVDLTAFSSSFLAAVLGSGRALHERGGELLVLDLPGPQARVVEMLGLDELLHIQPDLRAAVARARAQDWSEALGRVGREGPVRLALAVLHQALPEWAEHAPHDPRPGRVLAAAEAWLERPEPAPAQALVRACLEVWELWSSGAYGADPVLAWISWLGQRPELSRPPEAAPGQAVRPRLLERHLPAVREELLAWLLG